jgi:predicted MFS family arabinose efflux permease
MSPTPLRKKFGPLVHAPFRLLVMGRAIDMLGNAIAPIALAFAVLDLTHSAATLGLVVGARSAANVAFLLFGGVLADRLPRQVVLTGSMALSGVTQIILAYFLIAHQSAIPVLVILSLLNGALSAVSLPAASALTPQTVSRDERRQANAINRLITNTSAIIGASIGGILIAVWSPGWGLAIDSVTFFAAAIIFSRIRLPDGPPRVPGSTLFYDLHEGWSALIARSWLWIVILAFTVINAAWSGSYRILGPVVADSTIGRNSWGVVVATMTIGMFAGGLFALRFQPRRPLLFGMACAALASAPLLALALWPNIPALLATSFINGVAVAQFGVLWETAMQQEVPESVLARVYSYDMLGSLLAIPLGQVTIGPLAQAIGITTTLLCASALIVGASVVAMATPSVRGIRRERRAADPAEAAPV